MMTDTVRNNISITPSLVIEYLFCPRFVYFMEVLHIDQHEDSRYKVQKGREVHAYRACTNADYRRKRIGVVKKLTEQELYAPLYNIHGKVDEILFLENGTASPLDYKYAEFKGRIFKTYKMQSVLYSLMIKDSYNISVNRGYIVYTRSKNHIEEIGFTDREFERAKKIIVEILSIITQNYYPGRTKARRRCADCCYKNICIK
jgi:CRISPR-associated exonuclease Cas4